MEGCSCGLKGGLLKGKKKVQGGVRWMFSRSARDSRLLHSHTPHVGKRRSASDTPTPSRDSPLSYPQLHTPSQHTTQGGQGGRVSKGGVYVSVCLCLCVILRVEDCIDGTLDFGVLDSGDGASLEALLGLDEARPLGEVELVGVAGVLEVAVLAAPAH